MSLNEFLHHLLDSQVLPFAFCQNFYDHCHTYFPIEKFFAAFVG